MKKIAAIMVLISLMVEVNSQSQWIGVDYVSTNSKQLNQHIQYYNETRPFQSDQPYLNQGIRLHYGRLDTLGRANDFAYQLCWSQSAENQRSLLWHQIDYARSYSWFEVSSLNAKVYWKWGAKLGCLTVTESGSLIKNYDTMWSGLGAGLKVGNDIQGSINQKGTLMWKAGYEVIPYFAPFHDVIINQANEISGNDFSVFLHLQVGLQFKIDSE